MSFICLSKGRLPLPEFTARVHVHFWHPWTRAELAGVKKCTRVHGPSSRPSGVVIGGPTGRSPRATVHLLRGRHIERIVKKLCCVKEIKWIVFISVTDVCKCRPQNVTIGVQTKKFSARSARSIVLYPILKTVAPRVIATGRLCSGLLVTTPPKILAVPRSANLATCLDGSPWVPTNSFFSLGRHLYLSPLATQ